MPLRSVSTPLYVLALMVGAGCVDGSSPDGWELGIERSALEPDFAESVPLCPETDDWGPWGQTDLSTWDPDVRPVIEWIIDQTGISCSTYEGHHPSIGRAADWRPRSREEGTRLANWLQDHITGDAAPLGLYYVMWHAQIGFSDEIRDVEDRGSFTANHCDHVHMSFYESIDFRPDEITPWDDAPEPDAGPPPEDADLPPEDTGPPPEDSDPPPEDTGPLPEDGGELDAGPTPEDASPDAHDDADPLPQWDSGSGGVPMNALRGGCGVSAAGGRARGLSPMLALLR
jgi:hypothetical protein